MDTTDTGSYIPSQNDRPVVDKALAEEEIVGGEQEVPAEGSKPGQIIQTVNGQANADDLLEALELNGEYLQACIPCDDTNCNTGPDQGHECDGAAVNEKGEDADHQHREDATHHPVAPSENTATMLKTSRQAYAVFK